MPRASTVDDNEVIKADQGHKGRARAWREVRDKRRTAVKAVYSEVHKRHDPQFFLVRGVAQRSSEQPERAERLLRGLGNGSHTIVAPEEFGPGPRARVHSAEYL